MATAYEKVQLARGKGRPSGLSFIQNIFPDFIELHGDRRFADDPAVIGGIATLGGRAVTVIAIEKGADTKDKVYRNFGSPNPEGYRKALRLMKQAEKFHRPVICFVTAEPGAARYSESVSFARWKTGHGVPLCTLTAKRTYLAS